MRLVVVLCVCAVLYPSPALPVLIDNFDSRFLFFTGSNQVFQEESAGAIGGERDLRFASIGDALMTARFLDNEFEIRMLQPAGGDLTNLDQFFPDIVYDGIDGSNSLNPSLNVDLTDGGRADRFILSFVCASCDVPQRSGIFIPSTLDFGLSLYGHDPLTQALVGVRRVNLSPTVGRLELLFSDLMLSRGLVQLESVQAIQASFNVDTMDAVVVRFTELCTGNSSGCTDSAVPVPGPPTLFLFPPAIIALVLRHRQGRPRR